MRRPLVAGNWKMNGSQQSALALTQALVVAEHTWDDVEVVLFPPFVHLLFCQIRLAESNIRFGGQTVSAHDNGAYTGEISASMLADLGAHYVLIGHSERRQYFGEDNKTLEKQCDRAMSAGLAPMLCVGETLAQRERNETLAVIQEQLAVVSRLKDNCADLTKIVIAYEPVWAIGTGVPDKPADTARIAAFIPGASPPLVSTPMARIFCLWRAILCPITSDDTSRRLGCEACDRSVRAARRGQAHAGRSGRKVKGARLWPAPAGSSREIHRRRQRRKRPFALRNRAKP